MTFFFLPMKNLNFNGFMCVLNKAIFCLFSTGNFVRPYPIHRRIFQVVSVFFSNLFFLVASLASRDSIACYVNSLVRLSHLAFWPFWACFHCSCPSVFFFIAPSNQTQPQWPCVHVSSLVLGFHYQLGTTIVSR